MCVSFFNFFFFYATSECDISCTEIIFWPDKWNLLLYIPVLNVSYPLSYLSWDTLLPLLSYGHIQNIFEHRSIITYYSKVCLFTNIFLLPKRGKSLRFFFTPSWSRRLLASANALSVSSTPDIKPLSGRDKAGAVGRSENHRSIFALEDNCRYKKTFINYCNINTVNVEMFCKYVCLSNF